jgi:uncharacterized protein (DUF2164 family)
MTEFPLQLAPELRKEFVRQFQHYLRDEFELECGDLAAGLFIDFAGMLLGPVYYNAGLHDALALASQHNEGLAVDVLALEKEPNPRPSGPAR